MKKLEDLQKHGWQTGINEVVVGDCLEGMKLIPDKSVDLVLTDPPYGTTGIKWDNKVNFTADYKRLSKTGAIIFASQPFTSDLIMGDRDAFKYTWIWNKGMAGNFINAKKSPLKIHEEICVFGDVKYTPQMRKGAGRIKGGGSNSFNETTQSAGEAKWSDEYFPVSILDYNNASLRIQSQHPTQKPLELIRYLLLTYSKEGDLILDPFMGSWTTARAAKDLGRNFIGFELSEGYCRVGEKRLRQQNLF